LIPFMPPSKCNCHRVADCLRRHRVTAQLAALGAHRRRLSGPPVPRYYYSKIQQVRRPGPGVWRVFKRFCLLGVLFFIAFAFLVIFGEATC
jgi:hypothetical protein